MRVNVFAVVFDDLLGENMNLEFWVIFGNFKLRFVFCLKGIFV